jgi:FkbM family methyltransferase
MMRPLSKKRTIVLAAIATATGIALSLGWVYLIPDPPPGPRNELEARFGRKLYSQHDEELIVRDFFNDRREGFFLDVGGGHYKVDSTTYYLEKHLNWSGISVDAAGEYAADYERYRPRTKFFNFFVSDKSDSLAKFYVSRRNWRLSTGDRDLAIQTGPHDEKTVPTTTLNDLLDEAAVTRIDFLSMDIEMYEPQALAGFDIHRFMPTLVAIETHPPVRDKILDYFRQHGYVEIERYSKLDPLNKFFTPASAGR